MFFQLMLYDFITRLTFRGLVKLMLCLIALTYYTAYNLIERGHPGIHKAKLMVIYNKYAAILRPYEPLFISICIAVITLFVAYMGLCAYRNNKSPRADKLAETTTTTEEELLVLKEQLKVLQQKIEAMEHKTI